MQRLRQVQKAIEHYIQNQKLPAKPAQLYNPVDYIMALPAKRIRPALAVLGGEVFNAKEEELLPAAYAIEVFHNFSLVHDDIMDDADLRRGKLPVHLKYDTNTAILSGDVMLIYVYQHLVNEVKPKALKSVLQTFNEVAIGVCEGQMMDMNFETQDEVRLGDYLEMIRLKTSVLLGGALKIGAQIGEADENDAHELYQFGCKTGVAFQIIDDILDTFGQPEKVGKKPGGDIIQNKKTFLYIKALECANDKQKEIILNWYATTPENTDEKVAAIRQIFTQLGVLDLAKAKINELNVQALKHLDNVNAPSEKKEPLQALNKFLLEREY